MAAQPSVRTPFTLADVARIRGGIITPIHNNWCPSVNSLGECSCGKSLEYRITLPAKAQVR